MGAFDIDRVDFDLDGDGVLDLVDSTTTAIEAAYPEPRLLVARAFVTTPGGVELSAPVLVNVHLPHQTLGELGHGNPVDLAEGSDDTFYVLDAAAGRVDRYNASGDVIDSFGSSGAGSDQLLSPQALAVATDGRVFVADTGNDRVQVYSPSGVWQSSIAGDGELDAPRGVAIVDDRLVVSDTGGNRVRTFDLDGTPHASLSLSAPRGVTDISGFGAIIASPTAGLRSLVDETLASFPELDALSASLGPVAAVDVAAGDGTMLIADASAARILVLSSRLVFRRAVDGLAAPPLAVLPSVRREIECFT